MKTRCILSVLLLGIWSAGAAELKVATLDVQRLWKEYYRAEEISKGLNLVLNASTSRAVIGEVVFAKGVDDVTDKVLLSLNATKPASKVTEPSKQTEKRR